MADRKDLMLNALSDSLWEQINRAILGSFIVEFGIIKKVVAKGIVDVEMSSATSKKDVTIVTCVLASIASSEFSLNITPNVKDKVVVLFPRHYDNDMFDVQKTDVIINEYSNGYKCMGGIAILANQFRTNDHKNFIEIADGNIKVQMGYSNDDKKNYINFTVNSDGSFTYNSKNASVTVDKDGYLSYKNTSESNKTQCAFTSSGMTIEDANGNTVSGTDSGIKITDKNSKTIEMTSSGVTINGKLKVK